MTNDGPTNWWTRTCGGRDVLKLALPLVISTASWSLMNFCDRMFLLWHSTREMAAAMPAGMLYFTILCLPLGIALYVNAFVAQYQGAKRPERIGAAVWHGVRVGVLVYPFFLATIPLAPAFFRMVGHTPEIAALEAVYYQVLVFGSGGHLIGAALSTFFTGRGETRTVMMVSVSASLLNVALDYAWIFGNFGFPELGIEGAAWATVVSLWFRCFVFLWLMMRPANREKYQLVEGRRFDPVLFRRLLRYGGPNGLQFLVEIGAFAVFILLVGRLGENAMAATTLAFNVNALAFVPLMGLGVALTTMVGQQLGRNRPDMAAQATWTSLSMAMGYMGIMATLYLLVPNVFLMGHAAGTTPEAFGDIRQSAVVLLRFVAAYCLFDALNIVFASAIKGAGDTHFILRTNLILAPMPVIGAWLGITYLGFGLIWCWLMVTGWVCALGVVYMVRFLQGHWREMRVIEPRRAIEEDIELDETYAPPDVAADVEKNI
jgi:MATE family multidrug resistance protein